MNSFQALTAANDAKVARNNQVATATRAARGGHEILQTELALTRNGRFISFYLPGDEAKALREAKEAAAATPHRYILAKRDESGKFGPAIFDSHPSR